MPSQLVVAPTSEPVSVNEAKLHLRVDLPDDDLLIARLIESARTEAETITRRALISQQWRMVGDRFPSPIAGKLTEFWTGQQWGLAGMGGVSQFLPTDRSGYGVVVPISRLISVDSIKYVDTSGVLQTLAPSAYIVDSVSEPARIVPAFGATWPTTRQQINAVEVTFTAGYGATAASVPAAIKSWMLLRIGALYEHREAWTTGQVIERNEHIDNLLTPFRVMTF